jgi:hypothetical protein
VRGRGSRSAGATPAGRVGDPARLESLHATGLHTAEVSERYSSHARILLAELDAEEPRVPV